MPAKERQLACVASVSNRVIARKLEREQNKKKKVEGGGGGEKRKRRLIFDLTTVSLQLEGLYCTGNIYFSYWLGRLRGCYDFVVFK